MDPFAWEQKPTSQATTWWITVERSSVVWFIQMEGRSYSRFAIQWLSKSVPNMREMRGSCLGLRQLSWHWMVLFNLLIILSLFYWLWSFECWDSWEFWVILVKELCGVWSHNALKCFFSLSGEVAVVSCDITSDDVSDWECPYFKCFFCFPKIISSLVKYDSLQGVFFVWWVWLDKQ